MSLSLNQPVHASAYSTAHFGFAPPAHRSGRSLAMTAGLTTSAKRRTDALTGHAFSMPVVRELSIPPVADAHDRTW